MKVSTVEISFNSFELLRQIAVTSDAMMNPQLDNKKRAEKIREMRRLLIDCRRTCPDILPPNNITPFRAKLHPELPFNGPAA